MIAALQDATVNRKVTRLHSVSARQAPRGQAASDQLEFDWLGNQNAAWLTLANAAHEDLMDCSTRHVLNLIDSGALDVIDIRSPGATRPAYRILRDSVKAFLARRAAENGFELLVKARLNRLSLVMGATKAADFLNCSEFLILSHAQSFADIGAGTERRYLRIHRQALLNFILKRKVN